MTRFARPVRFAFLSLLTLAACKASEPNPADYPAYVEPDRGGDSVEMSVSVTVDTAHPELDNRTTLEPVAGPVTIAGDSGSLGASGFVRRVAARPDIVWVELFFDSGEDLSIAEVELVISSESAVFDLSSNPYSSAAVDSVALGNLGPEGMARVVLGLPNDGSVHSLELSLAGVTSSREARSSAPLAITPDGAEVWTVVPDADVVAVVDTASEQTVATLDTGARPRGVALTPDGAFAAVVSGDSNQVQIFDVATREEVAVFGEDEGVGRDPRHVVAAPDGSRFYVSSFVGASLTEVVRTEVGFYVGRSVALGPKPLGLGVSLDGSTVTVAHFLPRGRVTENEGWLSVVTTEDFSLGRELTLQDDFNLEEVECLTMLFPVSASRLTSEGVPTQLAGVFFPPSGNIAWVPGSAVGPNPVWETGPDAAELGVTSVLRPAEFLAPFHYILDGRVASEITAMLHPGVLEPPDNNIDYLNCAQPIFALESLARDVLAVDDNAYVNRGVATPTAYSGTNDAAISRFIGFSRGARRALALGYAADELAVTDALTLHGTSQEPLPLSGSQPTGLVVSPDGARTYVSYDNSTFLSVIDSSSLAAADALPEPSYIRYEYADVEEFPSPPTPYTSLRVVRYIDEMPVLPPLTELGQIALVDDPMDPQMRRGKVLFNASNPDKYPISASKIGACASCHPMGLTDGSIWGTMEGERRTTMLVGGLANRGWLHASGTHADVDEFIDIIVGERLAGSLEAADHDALAEYLAVGIPALQSPPTDPDLVARGQELFETNCASCHMGERLTSGAPDPNSPFGGGLESGPLLFDVGTRTDSANAVLGTFFQSLLPEVDSMLLEQIRGDRDLGTGDWVQETLDFRPRPDRVAGQLKAPTLTGVSHNVIFFHDGRFDSLGDVVAYFDDFLGLNLSTDDRAALVEYLRSL